MDLQLNFTEFLSSFIVLFAVIDITGSIPIILELVNHNRSVSASKTSIYSLVILIVFLFAGKYLLALFSVDISSFAVAGAVVLFVLACEMIFGITIFKQDGPSDSATIVPLVFPLITGAASFTTLLSLRAEYHITNIILAIVLNMLIVYFVIKYIRWFERTLGGGAIYVMRKFFGIILLAMSVRLFTANLSHLISM